MLVDPDGNVKVVGFGAGAYFMQTTEAPEVCREKRPLTFRNIDVHRVETGGNFDLKSWKSKDGVSYRLSVIDGRSKAPKPVVPCTDGVHDGKVSSQILIVN